MVRAIGLASVLLVLAAPVLADDLVRQMELEIYINKLSKGAYQVAKDKAWTAVKRTSLWHKRQSVRDAMSPVSRKCFNVTKENYNYLKASRLLLNLDAHIIDPRAKQFQDKIDALCVEWHKRMRTKEYRELQRKSWALADELHALRKNFTLRIFRQEMKKCLTELQIEITREVQKKVERSYKKWAA